MNIFKVNRLKIALDKMVSSLDIQYNALEEAEEALAEIYDSVDRTEEEFDAMYKQYLAEGGTEDYNDYIVPESANEVEFEMDGELLDELQS